MQRVHDHGASGWDHVEQLAGHGLHRGSDQLTRGAAGEVDRRGIQAGEVNPVAAEVDIDTDTTVSGGHERSFRLSEPRAYHDRTTRVYQQFASLPEKYPAPATLGERKTQRRFAGNCGVMDSCIVEFDRHRT